MVFPNNIISNTTASSLRHFTTTPPHHSRAWRSGRKLTFRKQTSLHQHLSPTLTTRTSSHTYRKSNKTYTRNPSQSPLLHKHPVLDPRDKHGEHEPQLTHLNASGEARMVRLPPTSEKPATSRTATATSVVVFSNPYPYRLIAVPLRAPVRAGAGEREGDANVSGERSERKRKSIEVLEAELWDARQEAAGITDSSASMPSASSSRPPATPVTNTNTSPSPSPSPPTPPPESQSQSPYHTAALHLKINGIPRPKGKGDILAVARIAGIQAAKETSRLIPLCHNIPLAGVDVDVVVLHPTSSPTGKKGFDGQVGMDEASDEAVGEGMGESSDMESSKQRRGNKTPRYPYGALSIAATVTTYGQTGVEMEALVAASVAGLTVYDMCKAVDRGMKIERVRVTEKRGGRSGDWVLDETGELRGVAG